MQFIWKTHLNNTRFANKHTSPDLKRKKRVTQAPNHWHSKRMNHFVITVSHDVFTFFGFYHVNQLVSMNTLSSVSSRGIKPGVQSCLLLLMLYECWTLIPQYCTWPATESDPAGFWIHSRRATALTYPSFSLWMLQCRECSFCRWMEADTLVRLHCHPTVTQSQLLSSIQIMDLLLRNGILWLF